MSVDKKNLAYLKPGTRPVINHSHLEPLLELDEELVLEIFQSFLDTAPEMAAKMIEVSTKDDGAAIEFQAHSIKGVAGNLGGEAVSALAEFIEACGVSNDLETVPEMSVELKKEIEALCTEIKTVLDKMTGNSAAQAKNPKHEIIHAGIVLCIDDDPSSCAQMKLIANVLGYEAVELTDPSKCDEYFNENLAMLLLDYSMQPISGLDVLNRFRQNKDLNQIPVIMATSKTDERYIIACLEAGANDYLTKPINLRIANARINTHLTHYRLQLQRIKERESDTIKSMVVTYNHEINNPLAVAMSSVEMIKRGKNVEDRFKKLETALEKIKQITKSIKSLLDVENVSKEDYAGTDQMYKLSK